MSLRRRSLAVALCLPLVWVSASASADPPRVGEPAPEVRARALEGEQALELGDHRGHVVVLAFVASWCRACRRLAPVLAALDARHGEALAVRGLSHESRRVLRAHVARREPGFVWSQCTGRTAIRYGADALPTVVVIDAEGIVRGHFQGASAEVVAELEALVASLVTE